MTAANVDLVIVHSMLVHGRRSEETLHKFVVLVSDESTSRQYISQHVVNMFINTIGLNL